MTRIHLIRHAKRERRPGDPALTAAGRAEAAWLARSFEPAAVHAVFTSPLRRAVETAGILAECLGLDVVADDLLRERINWGDLEGQSFDEFAAIWNRCCRDRSYCPPVGDSSEAAGRRIETFVQRLAASDPPGDVIAVSHGGIIADFLLNLFTEDALRRVRAEFVRDPYNGAVMRELSITTVVVSSSEYALEAIARLPSALQ